MRKLCGKHEDDLVVQQPTSPLHLPDISSVDRNATKRIKRSINKYKHAILSFIVDLLVTTLKMTHDYSGFQDAAFDYPSGGSL